MIEEKQRKVRSDKKFKVAPYCDSVLLDMLYQVTHITGQSMKLLGEEFCIRGHRTKEVIDEIAPYFQREFWFSQNTVIMGDPINRKYELPSRIKKERFHMGFLKDLDNRNYALCYALGITKAKAVGLLLEKSFMNQDVFEAIVLPLIAQRDLDTEQKKALNEVILYINGHNKHSKLSLLTILTETVYKVLVGKPL